MLLASLVQLMGEDKAFEYLKSLHRNVNQYTKSGAAPVKATALGETAVGLAFMHDMVTMIVDGAPVKTVAPCEGTGYETGSVSLVRGGKNPEAARRFYDWTLSAEAQSLIGEGLKIYWVPSNKGAKVSPRRRSSPRSSSSPTTRRSTAPRPSASACCANGTPR